MTERRIPYLPRKIPSETPNERVARAWGQLTALDRGLLVHAFIAETGMLPSEAELVEQYMSDGTVRVHVRKRVDGDR